MDKSSQTGEPSPDRLFVLHIHDLDDEQEFLDALDELLKALHAPYELKDDDWNMEVVLASGEAPTNSVKFATPVSTKENASNFTIEMIDSYGDGWNGAELTIVDDANSTLSSTTFLSGFRGTDVVTLTGGRTYVVNVSGGEYPNEVSWRITSSDDLVFITEDDDLVAESETIDLSQFFAGKVDLANAFAAERGQQVRYRRGDRSHPRRTFAELEPKTRFQRDE